MSNTDETTPRWDQGTPGRALPGSDPQVPGSAPPFGAPPGAIGPVPAQEGAPGPGVTPAGSGTGLPQQPAVQASSAGPAPAGNLPSSHRPVGEPWEQVSTSHRPPSSPYTSVPSAPAGYSFERGQDRGLNEPAAVGQDGQPPYAPTLTAAPGAAVSHKRARRGPGWVGTVVVALVAVARKRPTLAGRALGMVIGANVTTQLLKDMISRPDLGMTTGISNSLPSGHSTVAVTLSLALVAIAPQWLRAPSAWIGWAWTSLMGVSVMMAGWHRPADVVVAVLIAGAWALALSPIERRARHGKRVSKVMLWAVLAAGALAFSLTLVGLWGFSMSAGAPGSGYGFNDFLSVRPWRSLVLGMGACAWIVAVVGAVVREVDLLADDSRSA